MVDSEARKTASQIDQPSEIKQPESTKLSQTAHQDLETIAEGRQSSLIKIQKEEAVAELPQLLAQEQPENVKHEKPSPIESITPQKVNPVQILAQTSTTPEHKTESLANGRHSSSKLGFKNLTNNVNSSQQNMLLMKQLAMSYPAQEPPMPSASQNLSTHSQQTAFKKGYAAFQDQFMSSVNLIQLMQIFTRSFEEMEVNKKKEISALKQQIAQLKNQRQSQNVDSQRISIQLNPGHRVSSGAAML